MIGNMEITVRAQDKVSNDKGLPVVCVDKEMKEAFDIYYKCVGRQMRQLQKLPSSVHAFTKSLSLLDAYSISGITKILDPEMTRIFKMPMTNNIYRHSVATDFMKRKIPLDVTATFMRTSERMIKSVYEQHVGTTERLSAHTSIIKFCLSQNTLTDEPTQLTSSSTRMLGN